MSLFDPIASDINSLLDPLTSALLPDPESTQPARASSTKASSPSTSTADVPSTETSAIVISPSSTNEHSSSQIRSSATSRVDTSTKHSDTLSPSSSSVLPTTLSTATRDITSTTSVQTSTPAAPSANSPISTNPSSNSTTNNNHTENSSTSNGISTSGIAIAIVFAVAIIISMVYLTIRFCPPVRRRFDAWRDKGREERTYREALDGPGPAISEKDDAYSFSSAGSHAEKLPVTGPRLPATAAYATTARGLSQYRPEAASKEVQVSNQKAASNFHEKKASVPCELDTNQPWQMPDKGSAPTPVHHQYVSPISASSDGPRGDGLGLGRVSLLRSESPLQKSEYNVPPGTHSQQSSMDRAQTGIAMVGVGAGAARTIVPGMPQQMGVKQVEVKRKPIATRFPLAVRPFSYELPVVQETSEQPGQGWNGNGSAYKVQIHRSMKEEEGAYEQIGMAVSSTPQLMGKSDAKSAR